jgi:hypothetical protein
MKVWILTIAAAAAVTGWILKSRLLSERQNVAAVPDPPPTHVNNDSAEVFQKAFWQRPDAEDQILHAERREWRDERGVQQWQWFIAVKPSGALNRRLRQDNVFRLARRNQASPPDGVPGWFAFDGAGTESWQSASGDLRLYFAQKDGVLYGTGNGGGFSEGLPSTVSAATASVSLRPAGRLPLTPPPNPDKP